MRKLLLLAVAALLVPACSDVFNPLEEDAGEAGITVEVVKCEVDETSGLVQATAEVTSQEPHDTVLLRGEVLGEDNTVLLQTSSSLSDLEPGKTYRSRLTFGSLTGEDAEQDIQCDVQLDFASDFPG